MSQAIIRTGDAGFFHRLGGRRIGMGTLITAAYVGLYVLAIVLISLTDSNPLVAKPTWDLFIPLVGVVSAISGWTQFAGHSGSSQARYVIRQVLHWGALLLVIHLLFLSDVQHFLKAETDGFVIIYLVGLASILAGIYLDWKMALFGLFLIVSGVIIAFLDDNALLIAVSAAALMAITATAIVWVRYHQQLEGQRERGREQLTGDVGRV